MINKKFLTIDMLRFIFYSIVGIFLFFIPITIGEKTTIPLDHIVTYVLKIPYFQKIYGTALITIGTILPFYKKTWNKDLATIIFSILKILAIPFVIMAILGKGPEFLMNKDVIPFIFSKIVVPVTTIVPIGAIFLALIMDLWNLLVFL